MHRIYISPHDQIQGYLIGTKQVHVHACFNYSQGSRGGEGEGA